MSLKKVNVVTEVDLQQYLIDKFTEWSPPPPKLLNRTKHSITLDWTQMEPFCFITDQLLYRPEKNDKMPPWNVAYRGGKTSKEIDNLTPRHPHKFRLKVIMKSEAIHSLAERAIKYHGDVNTVYDIFTSIKNDEKNDNKGENLVNNKEDNTATVSEQKVTENKAGEAIDNHVDTGKIIFGTSGQAVRREQPKWLESQWSEEIWTNTDTDGTSITCFCMTVRCGYIKQVQDMLDERPELISILNPTNGFTPLITAIRKGDINTVSYLLGAGADIDQPSSTGQTALHIAVLTGKLHIVKLLIEKGAYFQARDINDLRVEHYAVDSCDVEVLRFIMDKGGDVTVKDNNGWTPLFRALCQGANIAIVEELVVRGSEVNMADKAGLPLTSVARINTNIHGRNRETVLRLVDMNYPHEMALANFTRLTKKIYNVNSLLKLPSLNNKLNLRK